jgi:aminoglycoside/choline kinase family phosphotransferase
VFYEGEQLIGSCNPEIKENIAHDTFTRHFINLGLPVPNILVRSSSFEYFILEDAGDKTLLDIRTIEGLSEKVKQHYFRVVDDLVRFQTEGIKGLDLSVAFPTGRFDRRSVMWDLNYFKYHFLKLAHIPFDEQLLEDDFQTFTQILLQADCSAFMFRDFQSRNIMLKNEDIYFIDYQGGRRGALQYDLASLLFDAKAEIPNSEKENLKEFYKQELLKRKKPK